MATRIQRLTNIHAWCWDGRTGEVWTRRGNNPPKPGNAAARRSGKPPSAMLPQRLTDEEAAAFSADRIVAVVRR